MTIKCSHCGAPLTASSGQTTVPCGYCNAVTRIGATQQHARTEPRQPRAARTPQTWVVGLAVGGIVVTGAITAVVGRSSSRTAPTREPAAGRQVARVSYAEATPMHEDDAPLPVLDAGSEPDAPHLPEVVATEPAVHAKPAAPVYSGPISTKVEAEQILRPEVLACMAEHKVHYLITRLGNKQRGANVPPLGLTGTSIVDYQRTPGFASTPLGLCIARAASAVRAPAYSGNYIYLGLRQESVPDPLADAPARLDARAAKQALSAFDDEARDCATRSPTGSRQGESVSIMMFFEGATGQVSKIEPYYVDLKSAYGRCLSAVYRKVSVDKFREIEHTVLHVLAP